MPSITAPSNRKRRPPPARAREFGVGECHRALVGRDDVGASAKRRRARGRSRAARLDVEHASSRRRRAASCSPAGARRVRHLLDELDARRRGSAGHPPADSARRGRRATRRVPPVRAPARRRGLPGSWRCRASPSRCPPPASRSGERSGARPRTPPAGGRSAARRCRNPRGRDLDRTCDAPN